MKKVTIAIIVALGLCSCSKDFITKDPLGVSSSATYYNDPAQCQLAVNAVYDPLGWFEMHDEFLWKIGDICSDDCERGGANTLSTYTTGDDWDKSGQLAVFEATDRSSVMSGIWKAGYIAIARANAMLSATEGKTSANYKKMRAEVRFLRAWYYFQLTKVFGPVILAEKTVSVADAENLGNRASGDDNIGSKQLKAQYDFIIKELEDIKGDLPKTAEMGKVTNGAARAFLAKAYLYRANFCSNSKDYENAYNTAYGLYEEANGSTYGLQAHYQDVFDIYGESFENSKEVVFAVQYLAGSKYGRQSDGTIQCVYVAPRYYRNPATNAAQIEDGLGYGFAMPTQDLLNEFEDGDARASMIVAAPRTGNADIDKSIDRLKLDTAAWCLPANISGGEGWYAIGKVDWNTGYYCMKKSQLSTLLCNSGFSSQCSGKNNIVLRWADVMLIAAEAGVQCGHEAEALKLVNELRERARNSARKLDYSKSGSSSACYTYTPSATPANLSSINLEAVKHERRVEMYCEAERYWDLVRWEETSKFRTQDISGHSIQYNEATLGRWPIPQSEIILHAGGNLKQNPGY
ncbi:MAG: RagB/SusD family nutrient uptake outer membrane protein [Bacteroidales bacterium]|nr:RagB/SusD family nutrient uptake outer membrane protein [Bacteroidales bacterium]